LGDPKKQRKKYETPLHPWRRDQIDVELRIMGDYGLRNKRELWRYKTELSRIRGIARSLLAKSGAERAREEKQFLDKLVRMGLAPDGAGIDAMLDLDIRDVLERRLQTVVFRSGMAKTLQQARQFVAHGHVSVAGEIVSVPGYLVPKDEEGKIKFLGRSPLAKADHPARKAAAGAAAAAPPTRPRRSPARGPAAPPIRAKEPPKVVPTVEEETPAEIESLAEPAEPETEETKPK
jgi:small subunit ribosomal protein S4